MSQTLSKTTHILNYKKLKSFRVTVFFGWIFRHTKASAEKHGVVQAILGQLVKVEHTCVHSVNTHTTQELALKLKLQALKETSEMSIV